MDDLVLIKKQYGEEMMHLCKKLFPTILEENGKLFSLLSSKFAYSKFLYHDIVKQDKIDDFKNYIFSLIAKKNNLYKSAIDPSILLREAGYTLFECHSEKDINYFKKYYQPNELLCTFNGNRLLTNYVFFAVKDNALKLKREDYVNPNREDEYGRSVISIQFTKGKINTLSIKNRYNHSVENPDATFNNNLDNIILGLTDSFANKYHLNIFYNKENFDLNGYTLARDGKFYKYNYEINNIYYCPNNIIIENSNVRKYENEKYLVIDYYIIDLVHKKISLFDKNIVDSFTNVFNIKKIEIRKNSYGKQITINGDNNITIGINKLNQIISYESDLTKINVFFMLYNKTLERFTADKLEEIENNFLFNNNKLLSINLPNLKKVGDSFLQRNDAINSVSFPKLEKVGDFFLRECKIIEAFFPNLKEIGNCFLQMAESLEKISLPELLKVESFFIRNNRSLKEIVASKLIRIGDSFLENNQNIINIELPNLLEIGDYFMINNNRLKKIVFPNLQRVGDSFLLYNNSLKEIELNNLLVIGDAFLERNIILENIQLLHVIKIGDNFLDVNSELKDIGFPSLEVVGCHFISNNQFLKNIYLPKLITCGKYFLDAVENLEYYDLSSLKHADGFFLTSYFRQINDYKFFSKELNSEKISKCLVKRRKLKN